VGATRNPEQIRADRKKWPRANIGLRTGLVSGFFVVDVDTVEGHGVDGIANLQKLQERYKPFPATLTAISPSGSLHYYFQAPPKAPIKNSESEIAGGVDIRGEGGMVLVPPSIKPNGGGEYRWLHQMPIAPAPTWLVTLARKDRQPEPKPEPEPEPVEPEPEPDDEHGFENILSTIGDGPGQKHFNKVLSRAAASYIRLHNGNPYDREKLKKLFREAINEAYKNPGRDPKSIERYLSDDYLDGIIESAEKKFVDKNAFTREDFVAYLPLHNYICLPTGEPWVKKSIDATIPAVPIVDSKGRPMLRKGTQKIQPASLWLDKNRPAHQLTWFPGEEQIIKDRLVDKGGWIPHDGARVLNLYRPPNLNLKGLKCSAADVKPWLDLLYTIYPAEAEHILQFLAHRLQRPGEKINHALVFGGDPGVGKDSFLEPIKRGVGPWNFQEIRPKDMNGDFNGFVKSVILRISEAHDLGKEYDRYSFYQATKTYTAAPPDVLRVNEKNLREYYIVNVCAVIMTTNYLQGGIYLEPGDRRHFVAWTNMKPTDFSKQYFNDLWEWYETDNGLGFRHVPSRSW
jgi:hypothetical protein